MPLSDVDATVRAHLDLAASIARRIGRQLGVPSHLRADLEAAAREGLFAAATRFDPSTGVPFAAYAAIRIRGAVLDSLRKEGGLPRRVYAKLTGLDGAARVADAVEPGDPGPGTAAELDAALASHLSTMATALVLGLHAPSEDAARDAAASEELDASPEDRLARGQTRAALLDAVARLDEPGRSLLRRHYFEGEPFGDVARELGHSPSWATRVHARALAELARVLGARDGHAW